IGGIVSPNFFQTKTILAISVLNYARLFWGFNEELGEDKNKDPVDVGAKKIGSNIAYFIEIAKAKSKHSDLDDIKIKPYKI
ncbi:22028_t:CDS:1, partial [Gigaspora rosea]